MIANIFGIEKLRFGTDGPGITTLVGMYKCPLNCEYCINNPITKYQKYTIEELYQEVYAHSLYFEQSGGGICFGGHEPLLQQKFIIEFVKYVRVQNKKWRFGLETSLNARLDERLLNILDYIIIDIKDINSEIYKKYTEVDNKLVLENLKYIQAFSNLDISIRLPLISGHNTRDDIEKSKKYLKEIGYKEEQLEVFEYRTTCD